MTSDDPRLTDLEIRYAHLERLAEDLSLVIAEQALAIQALQAEVRAIAERMQEPAANERPPHY